MSGADGIKKTQRVARSGSTPSFQSLRRPLRAYCTRSEKSRTQLLAQPVKPMPVSPTSPTRYRLGRGKLEATSGRQAPLWRRFTQRAATGAMSASVIVEPLRCHAECVREFVSHFEREWSDWCGPSGPGDASQDLAAFANPNGALPVGVIAFTESAR